MLQVSGNIIHDHDREIFCKINVTVSVSPCFFSLFSFVYAAPTFTTIGLTFHKSFLSTKCLLPSSPLPPPSPGLLYKAIYNITDATMPTCVILVQVKLSAGTAQS